MNILSFDEIQKITNSRYALAMLVSERAREIVAGDDPLVDTKKERPVSIALEEVEGGALNFATREEYQEEQARKAAELLERESLLEDSQDYED
ncbi:MAG: DNA-directed RNA polymerase subunit omega [Tissierellia bacterium]|nr:DNA-directed RNA polymerase subunit omega [Tissierellia bacterium]